MIQFPEINDNENIEEIAFSYEAISFQLLHTSTISDWLKYIIQKEQKSLLYLNYIFCSDDYLHKINIEYLNHDTYTDIITFPLSNEEHKIESDIYISIDRIKENAQNLNTSFQNELLRVMAHGVLHLCGYADKTQEEIQLMRKKENEAIDYFNNNYNIDIIN